MLIGLQAAAAAYLHTWLSTRTALSGKTGDPPDHLGRVFLERIILGLPNRVEGEAEGGTGEMCATPPSVQVLPDCDGPSALIVLGNVRLGVP